MQFLSVQRIKLETDAVQSNHGVESITAANDVRIFLKFVAGHPLGHEGARISAVSAITLSGKFQVTFSYKSTAPLILYQTSFLSGVQNNNLIG